MTTPLSTIYMTQEQDNDLRATIHKRRQQRNEVQDRQREPKHAKSLVSQATAAALLADMANATGGQENNERMPAMEVGRNEKVLEFSRKMVIKEPYFTLSDSAEPTLRVDHPSDLGIEPFDVGRDKGVECAEKYKTKGNIALRQGDLADAYSCYTQGLGIALKSVGNDGETHGLASDIHRNRSHVNLLLGRFDEALADALSSVTQKTSDKARALDAKAYFRAGCAAYRLEDWHKAKKYFSFQQQLAPDDRDAKVHQRKTEIRLREQAGAGYRFEKLKTSLSRSHPRVDAATYTGSTAIAKTTSHGQGLFATNDIAKGDIVLCEKAFCIVWAHEEAAWTTMTLDARDERIRAFPAGLAKALVQKLRNNSSQVEKVQALFSDHKGLDQLVMSDGEPVIDTFQIHDIICRNAFSPGAQFGEEDVRRASAGLWIRASYMNHSCVPNTEREFIGDLMVVRASRDVKAGDEITHIYDDSNDLEKRAESLMRTWGFVCECPRCLAEREDGKVLRDQRRVLEDRANALIERESPVGASRLVVRKAENLAKAIEGTYDAKRYEGLPRPALMNLERWLVAARPPKSKSRDI
ncbi:hypothetical protein PRZ48_015167 [Zasmidium cellare]|uniref:SET domain-containing protein n=1 Tax=Zasmidium cellare TaxID=395010 RepID=A0ABR0DXT7_ZASCE|nr:hypothetical protein PRZ48_015167 [Zasmidium cellare]